MKRNQLFLAVAAALGGAVAGCGDNSRQCGPGTEDVNGVCTGSEVVCTDGTRLNADGTGCEIDPNACQDGTVLVEGSCVDPGHVDADLEESAEPNGLGLFGEVSPNGAGAIVVPAAGDSFVIHGEIVPFQDVIGSIDPLTGNDVPDGQLEPDVDSFTIDVTGPVLVDVTADGLHGLAAGFVSLAVVDANDPLAPWQRFGLNLTGDTSQRQLYIPAAGTYILAVADTRSLFLTGGAAGSDDANTPFEYYVTITQQTITPEALTVTDGVATSTGELQPGEVKFFTVPMGEGINNVTLDAPAEQNIESLVVTNTSGATTKFKALADGNTGSGTPASAGVIGVRPGDTTFVVADHVFNYAFNPVGYELTVDIGTSGALSTDGQSVSQPTDAIDFSVFHYDVASDGEITGMDITFDTPVVGVVADEDFFVFSFFTFDPFFGFFFEDTFQDYRGLLRHQTAGRYYFLVFVPSDNPDPPEMVTATSSYGPVAAGTVTKGTPLAGEAVNAFESNPYNYAADVSTDAWQQFDATGSGSGEIELRFFNPTETVLFEPGFAFGKLDTLVSTCGSFCEETVPLFATFHPEAGDPVGRILLDDGTANYLVTANTEDVAGTFDLNFQRREHEDLGTLAAGDTATRTDQPLGLIGGSRLYLLRTAAGNGLEISVTPAGGTLDTRIQPLNNDESARGDAANNGGLGGVDSIQAIQSGEGWTAFEVSALAAIIDDTFDLSVSALAPVTYTAATGTTTFTDICATGTTVDVAPDADEGFSDPIDTPTGFSLFGFAAPQIRVNTNGFVTVDASLSCSGLCFFGNLDMPDAATPNGIIAPYWDDIVTTSICSLASGNTLTIQWTGTTFIGDLPVEFQVILDGSDNSVEFVYGGNQGPTGESATIGLENQVGSNAHKVGFNTAGTATPTKLTPM